MGEERGGRMGKTNIPYVHYSYNHWIGCTHAKMRGCDHCYAEALDYRMNFGQLGGVWGPDAPRYFVKNTRKPYSWDAAATKAGERYRVMNSLNDIFEDRPDLIGPRAEFLKIVEETPNLDWLFFTKRIENAERLLSPSPRWVKESESWLGCWHIPDNVWFIQSVSTQAELDRVVSVLEHFGRRFYPMVIGLSVEPLIEAIDLDDFLYEDNVGDEEHDVWLRPLDWVIVGGESLQRGRVRPCHLEWIKQIVDQCQQAGVPVYVKQTGSLAMYQDQPYQTMGKGENPDEWPEWMRVRELPGVLYER